MNKLLLFVVTAALPLAALAQNNPAVTQSDTTRVQRDTDKVLRDLEPGDTLPALYPDENEDIGPQSILRKKKQTWIRGTWDGQMFYTDNMNYEEHHKRDAVVAVNTLEAALTPPPLITPCGSYRTEIGYRHQFFNYLGGNNRDDFDFDSSTAFADVLMQSKHYEARIGFDYTQLLGFKPLHQDDYDEFYHEYVPRWSVQRNFRVCDRSMFSLAYLGSYHFTHEDPPPILALGGVRLGRIMSDRSERWEHTFLAAYSVALPCKFVAQPFYRFQFNDFVNAPDNYYVQTVGFSLGWFPCSNFGMRGFVGYNWSDAENPRAVEYTKLDAGAGVTATLRF